MKSHWPKYAEGCARAGDFGTLLYAGHDWCDRELARRSMVLMAEKVMPAINAATGKPKTAAAK